MNNQDDTYSALKHTEDDTFEALKQQCSFEQMNKKVGILLWILRTTTAEYRLTMVGKLFDEQGWNPLTFERIKNEQNQTL